jgi:hypothetical protein
MSQPAPLPYRFEELGIHDGTGSHIYLVDATGRKVGVVWGKREEKPYTAALLLAGANHAQKLAEALEEALSAIAPQREDYPGLNQVLQSYKEAMK